MENTPTPQGNPAKSGGLNVTVVVVALIVCATILGALFILGGKSGEPGQPSRSIIASKPEIPAFITWRETKLPGQTQVARIWAKPEGQLPLRVMVQVESSVSGEKKVQEVVLERSNVEEPLEIGFLEGHTFVPGDKVSVSHRDYSSVTSTCKALK